MVGQDYPPGKLSLHLPMTWDISRHLHWAPNERFHLKMRPPVFGSSFPHILVVGPLLQRVFVYLSACLCICPTYNPRRCTETNKNDYKCEMAFLCGKLNRQKSFRKRLRGVRQRSAKSCTGRWVRRNCVPALLLCPTGQGHGMKLAGSYSEARRKRMRFHTAQYHTVDYRAQWHPRHECSLIRQRPGNTGMWLLPGDPQSFRQSEPEKLYQGSVILPLSETNS